MPSKRKGKPRRQQPNLVRAVQAVSRMVANVHGDAEDEDGSSQADSGGSSRKRKLSRKELRKKARMDKKARRQPKKHPNPKDTANTRASKPTVNKEEGHASKGGKSQSQSQSQAKISTSNAQIAEADVKNALFYKMVKSSGLLGGENDDDVEEEDEDDKVIREMRKRLKLKGNKELSEGDDGLESIFSYKDDAAAEMKEKYAGNDIDNILEGLGDGDDDQFGMDESDSYDEDIDENIGGMSSDEEGEGIAEDDVVINKPELMSDDEEANSDEVGDGDSDRNDDDNDGKEESSDSEDSDSAEPAQFISRKDAYGDQSSGPTDHARALATAGRYVPPGKRGDQSAGSTGFRAAKQVKGLLNKLNAANLTVIVKDLVDVYGRNSRNEVSSVLTTFILDACIGHENTLKHLLHVYAAGVACLHHIIGMEVTAHFVCDLAKLFESAYKNHAAKLEAASADNVVVDKQCTNLLSLLAYMYNFKIIHSATIMGVLKQRLKSFNELDVELLLVVLTLSGHRLRSDDPSIFQELIEKVTHAASKEGHKPRVQFMLDSITDLKLNRKKLVKGSLTVDTLLKAANSFVVAQHARIRDPMRVPWQDILDADSKGRWWLVGSAWVGNQADGSTENTFKLNSKDDDDLDQPSNELVTAAAKQRMNTDIRRRIFYIIMGCEDYLDAFEKLVKLKLLGKQDREIIRVIVDCGLQEKVYNPFYAILATKLCQQNHNHKFTLQFAFWDRFKDLSSLTVPQTSNLARMLAHFVIEHALSLAMLKVVQFGTLESGDILFFQLFMVTLLTRFTEEEASGAFERISTIGKLVTLKSALVVFLRHYVNGFKAGIGNGGQEKALTPEAKSKLLKSRLKMAKRWLTMSSDGISLN